MKKNRNYKARLKTRLLMGQSVTPMQALQWWSCLRLAVYVNRLKNEGMKIKTDIVYKNGTSYAKYSLL